MFAARIFQFLICILLAFIPTRLNAKTIDLSPGTGVSLVEVVVTANAGDIIRVNGGIWYVDNLVIRKPITLIGLSKPVIDGRYRGEIITIMSDNVSITGFTIRNTKTGATHDYAGIRALRVKDVNILSNIIESTFFAVYFAEVKGGQICNNTITGHNEGANSGNGIHLWHSSHIKIEKNVINGHRDGIYFEFSSWCRVTGNRCQGNQRYGLHFMFSDNDQYMGNFFSNNACGVAVMYSKYILMSDNIFENNWGGNSYGLLLKDITDSYLLKNVFIRNTSGIYMEGTSRVRVENNDFLRNGLAVRLLANCESDTFRMNNFSGNTFDFTTNGTQNSNLLKNNYWDKYEGYDLNHDRVGDVPYRPVSLYSQVTERIPYAVILLHSFIVNLMDRTERALPALSSVSIVDNKPLMKMIIR